MIMVQDIAPLAAVLAQQLSDHLPEGFVGQVNIVLHFDGSSEPALLEYCPQLKIPLRPKEKPPGRPLALRTAHKH